MRLGLIRPDFPGERRVALLPQDMRTSENHLVIDEKFGDTLGIPPMNIDDEELKLPHGRKCFPVAMRFFR